MKRVGIVFYIVFAFYVFAFSSEVETNEVILPQTQFVVEKTNVLEDLSRDTKIDIPSQKKEFDKDAPSIKTVEKLEKDVKLAKDSQYSIVSSFTYGMNDFLEFAIVALNQTVREKHSVSFSVKYDRLKRSFVTLYSRLFDIYEVLPNSRRESDIFNFEVNYSSENILLSTGFEFFEDFKSLLSNPSFLDESYRRIFVEGNLKYKLDPESKFLLSINLRHSYNKIRDINYSETYNTFNMFSGDIRYEYGIEDLNFLNFGVLFGYSPFSSFSSNSYDIYGKIYSKVLFPIYQSEWFLGMEGSIQPSYTGFDFSLYARIINKFSENANFEVFLGKGYDNFDGNILSRGLIVLNAIPVSDSYIDLVSIFKFFLSGNIFATGVKYSYFFRKIIEVNLSNSYGIESRELSSVNVFASFDIVSLEWITLSARYDFRFYSIPVIYSPVHEINLSSKFKYYLLSFGLDAKGGMFERSKNDQEFDLPPYLILDANVGLDITDNISLIVGGVNLLNNLYFERKYYILRDPFYLYGSIRVKI